jgi:hypothetical protein
VHAIDEIHRQHERGRVTAHLIEGMLRQPLRQFTVVRSPSKLLRTRPSTFGRSCGENSFNCANLSRKFSKTAPLGSGTTITGSQSGEGRNSSTSRRDSHSLPTVQREPRLPLREQPRLSEGRIQLVPLKLVVDQCPWSPPALRPCSPSTLTSLTSPFSLLSLADRVVPTVLSTNLLSPTSPYLGDLSVVEG